MRQRDRQRCGAGLRSRGAARPRQRLRLPRPRGGSNEPGHRAAGDGAERVRPQPGRWAELDTRALRATDHGCIRRDLGHRLRAHSTDDDSRRHPGFAGARDGQRTKHGWWGLSDHRRWRDLAAQELRLPDVADHVDPVRYHRPAHSRRRSRGRVSLVHRRHGVLPGGNLLDQGRRRDLDAGGRGPRRETAMATPSFARTGATRRGI